MMQGYCSATADNLFRLPMEILKAKIFLSSTSDGAAAQTAPRHPGCSFCLPLQHSRRRAVFLLLRPDRMKVHHRRHSPCSRQAAAEIHIRSWSEAQIPALLARRSAFCSLTYTDSSAKAAVLFPPRSRWEIKRQPTRKDTWPGSSLRSKMRAREIRSLPRHPGQYTYFCRAGA